jgi:hypothetical protein
MVVKFIWMMLIHGNNLSIDESPLIDESFSIIKTVEFNTVVKDGHEEILSPFILSVTRVTEEVRCSCAQWAQYL